MKRTNLIGIAAMDPNRVIGKGSKIPWHYSADFKHFKETTLGHPIVMGRATFESLGNKPLPKRHNIVISSTLSPDTPNVTVIPSMDAFFEYIDKWENFQNPLDYICPTGDNDPIYHIFVIGGATIYEQLIPHMKGMHMTHIKKEFDGDVFMPDFESTLNGYSRTFEDNDDFKITEYWR